MWVLYRVAQNSILPAGKNTYYSTKLQMGKVNLEAEEIRWRFGCGVHPKYGVIHEISLNEMSFMGKPPKPQYLSDLECSSRESLPWTLQVLQYAFLGPMKYPGIKSLKSQMDDSQGCQCNTNGHLS